MKNRINLKELSELLNKEVENGNGDAYLFIGEYYAAKDNWEENYIENGETKMKTLNAPYSIYTDDAVKEKIMALNYLHIQKLTDEENLELKKNLEQKKAKTKKTPSSRIGEILRSYNITDRFSNDADNARNLADTLEAAVDPVVDDNTRVRTSEMLDYIDYLKGLCNNRTDIIDRLNHCDNVLNFDNINEIRLRVESIAEEIDLLQAAVQAPAVRVVAEEEEINLRNNDMWMF